ncbi:hypothetical protein Pan258_13910 [Symmachiella dynata]|uniref:TIGR03067 domain-containing protein n=1 Tax=Symmachiella dynata TaxID=2527995 RepID=UPI00118A6A99|nr:TIGR03067 domain-containing protein [Symmachiella dynata]QDT47357.1 hypothetical protein Pan258_13910 [Symmachiella dynata]
MKFGIAMGLAVSMLVGAGAPENDAAPTCGTLNGVWKLSSGEADGKALSKSEMKDAKLVIKGDQYRVTLPEMGTFTGTQILDATQDPKTIDITDATGPHKGKTSLGLYEHNGNEFRVVFAPTGEPRPTSFEPQPDSGQWMHVWKRVQE